MGSLRERNILNLETLGTEVKCQHIAKHINRVITLILSELFWSPTEVKTPSGKTYTQKVTYTSASSDKSLSQWSHPDGCLSAVLTNILF